MLLKITDKSCHNYYPKRPWDEMGKKVCVNKVFFYSEIIIAVIFDMPCCDFDRAKTYGQK